MTNDEQQIRALAAEWLEASRAGDTQRVLELIADDAIFLVAGRPPMTKADFAAASQPPPGGLRPRIDGESAIDEVLISGELAVMRSHLRLTITPPGAAHPIHRAGPVLTVFRKSGDQWRLARDANFLTTQANPTPEVPEAAE